jgi:23S rRNA (adenine2030-N6)-methyltransferase
MNYRHAYHAGNFADCFKHSLLIALLDSLARKPTPSFVLDTHAGAGWYDLDAEGVRRISEAETGIRRLLGSRSPVLERYLGFVTRLGLYPGSPAFIRATLRKNDRLVCCELHPEDGMTLRQRFRNDPQVEVHRRSGWEALAALLPPKEKRGLVFVDPPFEARDEFFMLSDGLRTGYDRFGQGIFAAWYPIKKMAAVRSFRSGLASFGIRDVVAVELHLRSPVDPDRLNGCGMVIVNPPYGFERHARVIADAVLRGLGNSEIGADTAVLRLIDE